MEVDRLDILKIWEGALVVRVLDGFGRGKGGMETGIAKGADHSLIMTSTGVDTRFTTDFQIFE